MTDDYDSSDSKEDIERTEDGRPMLSFPSMEKDGKQKTSAKSTHLHGDSVSAEKSRVVSEAIGQTDEFFYHPDSSQEKMNRKYCVDELESLWGSNTQDHLEIVKYLSRTYLDDDVFGELNTNGLGSHPIMLQRIYETGKSLEAEAVKLYGQTDGPIVIKGMNQIAMKKMGERCREALNKAVYNAQAEIIKRHGALPSW